MQAVRRAAAGGAELARRLSCASAAQPAVAAADEHLVLTSHLPRAEARGARAACCAPARGCPARRHFGCGAECPRRPQVLAAATVVEAFDATADTRFLRLRVVRPRAPAARRRPALLRRSRS